jgi:hypothetical protein
LSEKLPQLWRCGFPGCPVELIFYGPEDAVVWDEFLIVWGQHTHPQPYKLLSVSRRSAS